MTDAAGLRDRSFDLIDQIVQMTLKGQIRSKEQVYQMLADAVGAGTGEIFERCLFDRITTTEQQANDPSNELKQAKASRILRALQTISSEWERWQAQNQSTAALDIALRQIATSEEGAFVAFLKVTDPNQPKPLDLDQLQQLAKHLRQVAQSSALEASTADVEEIAEGIGRGLTSWTNLQNDLVSWIYEQSQGSIGFDAVPGQRGPWITWAKRVNSPVPASLFQMLAMNQSVIEWVDQQQDLSQSDAVELVILLRYLQQGLVSWFDKLVYDAKVGAKLSISTYLAFAVIVSQLASGFQQVTVSRRDQFVQAFFLLSLQMLRTFAQRPYFPLYGGIFASFTGEYLRDALHYLDEPLRQAEGTQEKARILTLLGYSVRALGQLERAKVLHQQAIEIARSAGDTRCEVANLNHLSRVAVAETNYAEAINYSQRALILSRQVGDRQGEANAIANLGYSEVLQAQQLEQAEPEVYEMAIDRLQQGLQLAEKLGDRQSQALCCSSLGIAHVVLEQAETAIPYLEQGLQAAQFAGDVYLQGLNLSYLAEAFYRLQAWDKTIQTGCLGMYLLEQIASSSWRQPAGLLMVLKGQLGETEFASILQQQRSQIVPAIGVDGYDYLADLLERYQHE